MFALSYLYKSLSLSLFLNLSYSPRGQQEKMGSNGVVIQTEDLESQGRGGGQTPVSFPWEGLEEKKRAGASGPRSSSSPYPSLPPNR